MINQLASSPVPRFQAGEDSGFGVRSVAELVATTMCGLHQLHGQFLRVKATVGDDGYISMELTRMLFDGEDVTLRVLLYPTSPEPIPSPARPRAEEHGVSADR